MVIKLVTYATHNSGTFKEIKNNKFDIDVTVLGWKQKWNGFMDKFKGVRKYIDSLDDNDIVVFIDGFDSVIQKSLYEVENRFKSLNCGVLVSEDPEKPGRYISKKVFGTCNNDKIANTGLYMGYVKYLKKVIDSVLKKCEKCNDDQRNLNKICKQFDYIMVDENELVFSNKNNRDSCFVQNPGKAGFNRYVIRGFKEYSQFFLFEVIIISLLIFIFFKKLRLLISIIFIFLLILFLLFADTSCM